VCREFAKKAFQLGDGMYIGLHKPYFYTTLQAEVEDDE
jgi:hypothetical protein